MAVAAPPRGAVWKACARIWANLPPRAVSAGDRVSAVVVRVTVPVVLEELAAAGGFTAADVPPPSATWVSDAVASHSDNDLVGFDEFIEIIEQYLELAELAGKQVSRRASFPNVSQIQESEEGLAPRTELETFVERLCLNAFGWVEPDGSETILASQAKAMLTLVFSQIGAPVPQDAWFDLVLKEFAESSGGALVFEDISDIAIQHVEAHASSLVAGARAGGLQASHEQQGERLHVTTSGEEAATPPTRQVEASRSDAGSSAASKPPSSGLLAVQAQASAPRSQTQSLHSEPQTLLDMQSQSERSLEQSQSSTMRSKTSGSDVKSENSSGQSLGAELAGIKSSVEEVSRHVRERTISWTPERAKDELTQLEARAHSIENDVMDGGRSPARKGPKLSSADTKALLSECELLFSMLKSAFKFVEDMEQTPRLSSRVTFAPPARPAGTSQQLGDEMPIPEGTATNGRTTASNSERSEEEKQMQETNERSPTYSESWPCSNGSSQPLQRRKERKTTTFAEETEERTFEVVDTENMENGYKLAGERRPSGDSSFSIHSVASSACTEVWDANNPTPLSSASSLVIQRTPSRRPTRKYSVPIATQVMTPTYSSPNEVFMNYVFQENRGEGAFGTVMRVQHKGTGFLRACKTIKLRNSSQKQLVETEMELMRKLDHPNVLQLFECYYDGDMSVFLVIELCSGGTLAERMEKTRDHTKSWVPKALRDLLAALEYCHRRKIVHRDIKPDNLLFQDDWRSIPDTPLKVIDFGLSEFLVRIDPSYLEAASQSRSWRPKWLGGPAPNAAQRRNTQKNAPRVGTPHYMAPEIYLEAIYEPKVDIFAAGVVLAELLTGKHPFFELGRDNLDTIRKRILSGRLDYDAPVWRGVPADAKALCAGLLEPDRLRRFDAVSAIRHPWVLNSSKRAQAVQTNIDASVFSDLVAFQEYHVLKQAALRVMARQLDGRQRAGMLRQFEAIDVDGNGSISAQELQDAMKRCGVNLGPHFSLREIMQVFDRMDGRSSDGGEIAFSDFLAALLPRYHFAAAEVSPRQLEYVFRRFCDGNDVISRGTLQRALSALAGPMLGVPVSNAGEAVISDDLDYVFADLCGRGAHVINFNAFCAMFTALRPDTGSIKSRP